VRLAVIEHVIDRQELRGRLSTASAGTAVLSQNALATPARP
jgi:hypothetical protein